MLTGEVGPIWVRSDVATVGYWNNPAATAALLRDGWICTGDLAWADAEGYLYFVGRRATTRRGGVVRKRCLFVWAANGE